MRFFKRVKTSVTLCRNTVVRAVVQGSHGVSVPTEELEAVTHTWLMWLINFGEPLEYELQIEARRIPTAKGYKGVRVITLPAYNPCSLELRVRGGTGDYQWKCHLVCPNTSVAQQIISVARPEATAYMAEFLEKDAKNTLFFAPNRETRRRSKPTRDVQHNIGLAKELMRRKYTNELCSQINSDPRSNGHVPAAVIRSCAGKILRQEIDDDLLGRIALGLVGEGILEPNGVGSYLKTVYFAELVEDYANDQRESDRERLEQEMEMLERFLKGRYDECSRIEKKLREAQAQAASMRERIEDISTTIAQLK